MKKLKYNNRKTKVDGHVFDSKKEARRALLLTRLLKSGVIKELVFQPRFPFSISGVPLKTGDKGSRQITYVGDFSYTRIDTGEFVVEDTKSPVTKKLLHYKIKKALMNVLYNIKIKEV